MSKLTWRVLKVSALLLSFIIYDEKERVIEKARVEENTPLEGGSVREKVLLK